MSNEAITDVQRWRHPADAISRMSLLKQRQEILHAIRDDLYSHGFLEVETPLLVKGTCPDTYIESVVADGGYLVTSTEYQIKRMMVGGFEKVFTLTKNFRGRDHGQFHSPEFTMLEWARASASLEAIEEDAVRFIRRAFRALYPNESVLQYRECKIDLLERQWQRLTVHEAFEKYLGLKVDQDFSLHSMLAAIDQLQLTLPENFRTDQHLVLSYLLDQVQNHLGKTTPTFLTDWPAFMTSSALGERSELYIAGIEISDGFPFLRDSQKQRELFAREQQRRIAEGKSPVALDQKYIEALDQGLPPGAGMALGIDRLVMVLTGSREIARVQAFSWDEL